MAFSKPFFRNVRGMKPSRNAGYSGWAFIEDEEYAENPAHYTRALLLILEDLKEIFDYVEPSQEGKSAFSYRIHALLTRTCIEIEANFKAILGANTFTPSSGRSTNIRDYRRVDATHHLSSYDVILPIWNGTAPVICPFSPWREKRGLPSDRGVPLPWYQDYNASKHDRQQEFKRASLWTLIEAVSALLILISSQFKNIAFDAKADHLTMESGPFEPSIGELFRIKYPDDWADTERYDFDWAELKFKSDRFAKIDYNSIPL